MTKMKRVDQEEWGDGEAEKSEKTSQSGCCETRMQELHDFPRHRWSPCTNFSDNRRKNEWEITAIESLATGASECEGPEVYNQKLRCGNCGNMLGEWNHGCEEEPCSSAEQSSRSVGWDDARRFNPFDSWQYPSRSPLAFHSILTESRMSFSFTCHLFFVLFSAGAVIDTNRTLRMEVSPGLCISCIEHLGRILHRWVWSHVWHGKFCNARRVRLEAVTQGARESSTVLGSVEKEVKLGNSKSRENYDPQHRPLLRWRSSEPACPNGSRHCRRDIDLRSSLFLPFTL